MFFKSKFNFVIGLNVLILIFSIAASSLIFMLLALFNIIVASYLKTKRINDLYKYRNYILGLAIFNLVTARMGSFILFLIVFSMLDANTDKALIAARIQEMEKYGPSNNEKVKKQVDPQIRKIDILLKLGVVMVFIAGFVFATTGWYSLNSIVKLFIFFLVACLFIGLSLFSEKKIKIKSTIYLYWILGIAFLFMIFLAMGYSLTFGHYFSLLGEGSLLYCGFCGIIFSLLAFITYFKFEEKLFLNLVYSALVLVIVFIGQHFKLGVEEILMLLVPIFTVISLFKINKKSDFYTLSIFSKMILFILGVIFIAFIGVYSNVLATVPLSLLFVFNIYYYIYHNKESDINLFASFIGYVLIIPSLILIVEDNVTLWVLLTTFYVTIMYLLSLLFNNKVLKNSSLIIADVITILVFVISINGSFWVPLVVSLLSLLVCGVCTYIERLDDYDIEIFVHPVKISMGIYSVIHLVKHFYEISSPSGYWLCTTLLFYILVYCLSRKPKLTDIYEKFSIAAIIICLLFTTLIQNLFISLIIFIGIVLFYAEVNWIKNRTKGFKNFVFVLLLANVIFSVRAIEIVMIDITTSFVFSSLVSILLFVLIGVFHRKDEVKLNMSLFAILIPLAMLIEAYSEVEWATIVLPSIFAYYLTFILSRVVDKGSKDFVGYIGYSIAFLLVIFTENYYALAYSFILIIVSLLLGYIDKNYNALFRVSVVSLILVIIYQLKSFWSLIPAWLYLLIFGLTLIIFATYKQLKFVENKDKKNNKK